MPYYSSKKDIIDPDLLDIPLSGIALDNYVTTTTVHHHQKGQLCYCASGIAHFYSINKYILLTPGKAVWIPAHYDHHAEIPNPISLRSLYIDTSHFTLLPITMTLINITPLLKALIDKACHISIPYLLDSAAYRLAMVTVDEIASASTGLFSVPRPEDKSLIKIFEYLQNNPKNTLTTEQLAEKIHITTRTLNRRCQKELGMSFEKWRLQIKLLYAVSLLDSGFSTTRISQELNYSNDSAFITMFKRLTGETPSEYKKRQNLLLMNY